LIRFEQGLRDFALELLRHEIERMRALPIAARSNPARGKPIAPPAAASRSRRPGSAATSPAARRTRAVSRRGAQLDLFGRPAGGDRANALPGARRTRRVAAGRVKAAPSAGAAAVQLELPPTPGGAPSPQAPGVDEDHTRPLRDDRATRLEGRRPRAPRRRERADAREAAPETDGGERRPR
jgi:hypothetical protein